MEFKEAVVLALETASSWFGSFFGDPRTQGVILGFMLSQSATFLRDWLAARRQAKSVRKMLELEMEHNLKLIGVIHVYIRDWPRTVDPRLPLTDPNLFSWQQKAFQSQIPLLPIALSTEEISAVYGFYGLLDGFASMYSQYYRKGLLAEYDEAKLREMVEDMLGHGNPLAS